MNYDEDNDERRAALDSASETDESAIDYQSQMAPATYRNSSAPTVVLFGWFGCRDQYLAKYSELYTKKGCQTVRFTSTHLHAKNLPGVARRFYNDVFVGELDLQAHSSFIIHVFSNNGARMLDHLLKHIDDQGVEGKRLMSRLRGVAFDSCPARVSLYQGARATVFGLLSREQHARVWFRRVCIGLVIVRLTVRRCYEWVRRLLGGGVTYSVFDALKASPFLPHRQLYLYSQGDEICPASSIEAFIAKRREFEAGTNSTNQIAYHQTAVKFSVPSPHCEHLRHNAIEYTRAVHQFVDNCIVDGANLRESSTDDDFEKVA